MSFDHPSTPIRSTLPAGPAGPSEAPASLPGLPAGESIARSRVDGTGGRWSGGASLPPVEACIDLALEADEDDSGDNPLLRGLGSFLAQSDEPEAMAAEVRLPSPLATRPMRDLDSVRALVAAVSTGNPILQRPEVARALALGGMVAGCALGAFALGVGGAILTMAVEALAFAGGFLVSRAGQQRLAEANERLQYEASHDGLTGLLNRRSLLDALQETAERASREGTGISVLMADVDHFKQVNDTHGHQAGDDVLRVVARRVSECLREGDRCGRYGGEEFLVILPEHSTSVARAVAERIRQAVAGDPVATAFGIIRATISIGVAASDRAGYLPDLLVRAADEALYLAKHNGRNRVETAPGPVAS